ncbi:ATP-dependent helicase [Marinifilum sp. JC120]|nr:ATP-dependent helicase [Marinifilum sp. JC120]
MSKAQSPDDVFDAPADVTIRDCLTSDVPKSFFLFAGAGSGKTRSLVEALKVARTVRGDELCLHGRKIGVITYTNNACDEIKRRIEFDDLFEVSTIHSFAWSLIKGLHNDIREWLRVNLNVEIIEIREKEAKGRAGTKASAERLRQIAVKSERIEQLDRFKEFIYNPNGDNYERNALNHSEIIKISSGFLAEKPMMQSILVNKFPILLIDESQDTNKHLMNALLVVQALHSARFVIGVIGDTMQRIYFDGKTDLAASVPEDWAKPAKLMNHRCYPRIVEFINNVREPVDNQRQRPRQDKPHEGLARLFVLPNSTADKGAAEKVVYDQMKEITGDDKWSNVTDVKTLVLEHRMAANRLGFLDMWDPLSSIDKLKTGLNNGELPSLRIFSELILPVSEAAKNCDRFAVGRIVRENSPLLDKDLLKELGSNQLKQLKVANKAVQSLVGLLEENPNVSFFDVLHNIAETNLFLIPDKLKPFSSPIHEKEDEEDDADDETKAWRQFGATPFQQIKAYSQYVKGDAPFDTHHGVKGLEFSRVCVVLDDHDARGFMFSYEKLFGVKEGSPSSIENTRRLFYVTCSRAEESLALIMYSDNPDDVANQVIKHGWFSADEIVLP